MILAGKAGPPEVGGGNGGRLHLTDVRQADFARAEVGAVARDLLGREIIGEKAFPRVTEAEAGAAATGKKLNERRHRTPQGEDSVSGSADPTGHHWSLPIFGETPQSGGVRHGKSAGQFRCRISPGKSLSGFRSEHAIAA